MEGNRGRWLLDRETVQVLGQLVGSRDMEKLMESGKEKKAEKEEKKEMGYALDEWMDEERENGRIEGRREGIFELLEEYGEVSNDLKEWICGQKDVSILRKMLKAAAKANSVEEFASMI